MEAIALEQARLYINSLDFSMIINKLVKHGGWNKKHAERLADVYKKFLFLNKKYGHLYQLPPSEEIDEFWHNHILDTKKYRADCDKVFGEYRDHYPYFGIDGSSDFNDLENAFKNLQDLYLAEFGEELPKVTHRFSKIISAFKRLFYRIH